MFIIKGGNFVKKSFIVMLATFFISIGIGLNISFADTTNGLVDTNSVVNYGNDTLLSGDNSSRSNSEDLSESTSGKPDSTNSSDISNSNPTRERAVAV